MLPAKASVPARLAPVRMACALPAPSIAAYICNFAYASPPRLVTFAVFLMEDHFMEKPPAMKRFLSSLLCLAFVLSTFATADEGMWLYNAPPKDKIKAAYGFELTQAWLDHVRLSSVRFNNG